MSGIRDKRKEKQRLKPLWLALLASAIFHPLLISLFEWTRDPNDPRIFIGMSGKDLGVVQVPNLISCTENCELTVKKSSTIKLMASSNENVFFDGWDGPCGNQRNELYDWLGRALGDKEDEKDTLNLLRALGQTTKSPPLDPKICEVQVEHSLYVKANFSRREEEEAQVEWIPEKQIEPTPPESISAPRDLVAKEKEDKPKTELKIVKEEKIKKLQEQEKLNLKSVSVPDKNEVSKAPDDARFLSDKNRDVAVETRSLDTNLEKQSQGEDAASSPSDLNSEEVGGEEAVIAEAEDFESEDDKDVSPDLAPETANKKPGLLSMRGIKGQGELKSKLSDRGGVGQSNSFNPHKSLSVQDYERIVGTERFAKEQASGRKKRSTRVGRHNARMKAFRSTLETFTPEVGVGNQTALKTRSHPFALYLDAMHREIHKRWGFGFLVRQGHKFPDTSIWGKLEIVIKDNGEIDNIKFAKSSGNGIFDAAAWSVMENSGPFQPPPKAIQSPNTKTYIHWRFHRDGRQCGTFGATPFILNEEK